MESKVSLLDMRAEMDSDNGLCICDDESHQHSFLFLFDRSSDTHQYFYRFISTLISLEKELSEVKLKKGANTQEPKIDLNNLILTTLPSDYIDSIIDIVEKSNSPEDKSKLGIKIKTSWFESLPNCIKEKVLQNNQQTPLKPTATMSEPKAIRVSPKRSQSTDDKKKIDPPPEKSPTKKSSLPENVSFLKTMGKREMKFTLPKNDAENKGNVL